MTNSVIDNTTGGNLDRVILWQYDHADNLISIIELFSQFFKDSTTDFFDEYVKKFNLSNPDEVTDYGLAVWGKVLDIPRPTLTYTDNGEEVTRTMSKELYRRILAGRIVLSEKNASVPAYVEYVTSVFGDGVTVIDGQDMSLSFVKNESAKTPLTAEATAAIEQYPDVVFAYPSGVRSNGRSDDPIFALDGQQTDTDDTDPIAGGLDESGFNWRITPKGKLEMTQSDFNTKYGRIAMPMPFAGAAGAALARIAHTSGSVVNFPDGFPQNYSAPHSKGGKYITRGEMNAIGHLATVEGFYRQCGGLNLFDQELCNCIGGYPAGAVLDYLSGRKIYKILSLKDNNKVDFTGATPKYPDIVSGSVDNVNWIALNQDDSDIGRQIAFRFNFDGDSYTTLGRFVSSMTSPAFKIENNLLKSQEASGADITIQCDNAGGIVSYVDGFCFAIKDLGTSVPSTDPIAPSVNASWNPSTSQFSVTTDSNGWCALANFSLRYTAICWNAVTSDVRSISVREFDTDYTFDIFPGFTKDHYYEIRCFGNCSSHSLVRQESQSVSSVSATIAYGKFKISGNMSLMY